MTRFARIDMDAVAPLLPADKVAGRVAARGEHFEWSPPVNVLHSETPLAVRRATPRELLQENFIDLTGVIIGRLTVLGISALSDQEKRRWVVRCVCGHFEVRRAKFIKSCMAGENTSDKEPMCECCGYTRKLQQGYHNPKKAAAAAEAIQNSIR